MPSPNQIELERLSERSPHASDPRAFWTDSPPVLLCDPSAEQARRLASALAPEMPVLIQTNLDAADRVLAACPPAVLILPLSWPPHAPAPGRDSPILKLIRAYGRRTAVVVHADTDRVPLPVYCQALAAGARQVVNEASPAFLSNLREMTDRLIRDHQAQAEEQEELADQFAGFGLIGRSTALRDVFRRAVKASHFSDLPVLLLGETGTGKQRLAEAIHQLDPKRRNQPFVTVNCGALSKSLVESELFGHARGAFSGASGERQGLFRSANGGTLLLDEIGELDLDLQPKLLRVLQERRLLPVGEDYEHAIDIRVIAATNCPLREMVARGKFREDLYQRLNVLRITIPPLRERPEDIELQARYFRNAWTSEHGTELAFGPRVLEALRLLPWEGNSRQLKHFLWEVFAHQADGPSAPGRPCRRPAPRTVQMEDLPRWVVEKLAGAPDADTVVDLDLGAPVPATNGSYSLSKAMEEYERRLLAAALEQNDGNRTRTAALLGLTPRSIFNKIKKYGLE